jgi:hypothetical protein
MAIGVKDRPIFNHELPSVAWRLLWWLICNMDEHCELRGGWRSAAVRDMKVNRQWLGVCAEKLVECNLIDTGKKQRYVKVLKGNITA